jgi:hypothetical protein
MNSLGCNFALILISNVITPLFYIYFIMEIYNVNVIEPSIYANFCKVQLFLRYFAEPEAYVASKILLDRSVHHITPKKTYDVQYFAGSFKVNFLHCSGVPVVLECVVLWFCSAVGVWCLHAYAVLVSVWSCGFVVLWVCGPCMRMWCL